MTFTMTASALGGTLQSALAAPSFAGSCEPLTWTSYTAKSERGPIETLVSMIRQGLTGKVNNGAPVGLANRLSLTVRLAQRQNTIAARAFLIFFSICRRVSYDPRGFPETTDAILAEARRRLQEISKMQETGQEANQKERV